MQVKQVVSLFSGVVDCRFAATVLLVFGGLFAGAHSDAAVIGEMDFVQIEPVAFSFDDESTVCSSYTSSVSRLWYTHYQAEQDYETKPLFVFLNGGPGCGTCMNLFSMNTAPYSLDRNRMASNELYKVNPYSWTSLGNLLYIDAPNTGYSYMISDEDSQSDWFHLWKFLNGANCQPFIDAAQVLRTILHFLDAHPALQSNEVILVGESYSGVRVSTMLNLLLYHQQYADGEQVYHDQGLITSITNHFKSVLKREPPFSPEDVATQFGKQILIQPQIVDKYQGADMYSLFEQPDSAIARLGMEAHATNSWEAYLAQAGGTCTFDVVHGYLAELDRDPYHTLQEAAWTDDNEYFSMERLNDFNALQAITGNCSPSNVPHLLPAVRTNALKFAVSEDFFSNSFIKWLVNTYLSEGQIKMLETMVPGWKTGQINMEYNPDALLYRLGKLSGLDAYVTGTNPYIFLGFMMNSGGNNLLMILYSMRYDPYDISAEKSDRYGRMFLENLAIVDTFMTDAAHDYVVYSPTLPSQFGGSRFTNYVRQISTGPGDSARRYGSFTVDYTENAVPALQHSPDSRTVSWRYYGESGHAVSASQPEEFRDDVAFWLQHRWYNVYPREGSVTGSTEVTLYGENLCVDSNDLQSVTVCGYPAEVLRAASGQITFKTPPLPPGAGDVVIDSTTYGTLTASNSFCAKLPQSITVLSPDDSTCFAVNQAIDCLATSSVAGLPVSFSVYSTDPLDGPTNGAVSFSMPAAGTATIWFEQPGNDSYFAAEPVIRHIAVTSDAPKVYYVSPDGNDTHHGLSWAQAKRTPQGAAERAVRGDSILVSNGLYNISVKEHSGSNRVVLSEGVTMRSVNGAEVTIIDGSDRTRGVYLNADATLDGFTVRNGALGGAPSAWRERSGAGIFASPRTTIKNCIIQSNAIALSSSSYGYGGGVCMENDVTLSHCLVLDNRVETSGDNALGGGIAIAASATNCLIANSVLAGNQSLHEGGGLYLDINTHSIHLLNCTITENSAPNSGSGIMAYGCDHTINNSIVYGNTGASDLFMTFSDDVWYTNSCVPSTAGNGHFVHAVTNDPHFQTEPRGMIAADSPCRDQGENSLTNSSTDAACRPRVINDVVDIGAYEFQRWVLTSACGELIFPDDPPSVTNGTDLGCVDFGTPVASEIRLENVSSNTIAINIVLRGDGFSAFSLDAPSQLSLAPNSTTNIPFTYLATCAGTSLVELCFTDFELTSFVRLRGAAKAASTLSTPADLTFTCSYNYLAPDPQPFAITNFGPSDCTWQAVPSASWMHLFPETAELPATNAFTNLIAYVIPGELPVGIYVSTNLFVSPSAHTVTQRTTLTITRGVATILAFDEQQEYDGTGKSATITTIPPDLPVTTTYNGATTLPIGVGTYAVTATVDTANYAGQETCLLTIEKGEQTLSFPQSGLIHARFGVDLTASASSGLPVTFSIDDMVPSNDVNRASIYNGYQLRFQMEADWAELLVVARQPGDTNWKAQAVTNAFQVSASQSFSSWADTIADPAQRGLTNCPAGDGIPNLLKYALGLNPEQPCSQDDIFSYQLTTNALGEPCLLMSYQVSTETENIQVGPVKTTSLLTPSWNTNGILNSAVRIIDAYERWESTLSTTFTNSAYMRLKVKMLE